jgi:murein DD-endopeptidase MepM/ murein hydrolase activator NlpD
MSRYAKGLRSGSRVRQGEIIGYVGASGLATAPHLHYEFMVNGVFRNPRTVPLPQAEPVPAAERERFIAAAQGPLLRLDARARVLLAQSR